MFFMEYYGSVCVWKLFVSGRRVTLVGKSFISMKDKLDG